MGSRVVRRIEELGTVVGGATPSTKDASNWDGDIAWLSPKDLTNYRYRCISRGERNISEKGFRSTSTKMLPAGSVLFSSRAPIGYIAIAENDICTNQGFKSVVPNDDTDSLFLYYLLKCNKDLIEGLGSGTTFKEVSGATMKGIELEVPDTLDEQHRIAAILDPIDSKIEANQQINDYLTELIRAEFNNLEPNQRWLNTRADELFKIGIGKTPPRKEPEWFSDEPKGNVVWLSIKDMGGSGAYSFDSSEYLTPQAVESKNVRKVPKGSVLLSFKLTVGRVKIAAVDMTTNEAIACFASDKPERLAYIYPYLLGFDYNKLGSTSSIATAVNSKTIKAMPVAMPDEATLQTFYATTKPYYKMLYSGSKEIRALESLRDTLLPKLMSGEIDVSKVDLTRLNNHLSAH